MSIENENHAKNQKKAKFEDIKKYVKAAKQFAKKGPKGLENAKKIE